MIYGTAARRQQQETRDLRPYEYWTYDRYFDDFFNTYSLPVGGFEYWNYPVYPQSAPEIFPTVRVITPESTTGVLPPANSGNETVVPQESTPTAQETAEVPGDVGPVVTSTRVLKESDYIPDPTPQRETDWDWVYSQYVILNPPVQEVPVAVDWGDIVGSALGSIAQGIAGPTVQPALGFGGTYGGGTSVGMPTKVTVDTVTGKITPCRRRRRRRLLTASDLNDLAALKTIIGGGSAMNAAVVKAIR